MCSTLKGWPQSVKKCDNSKISGFHVGYCRNFWSVAYREYHHFGICGVHSKGDHKVWKSVIIVKCADFTWDLPVTFGALRIVSITTLGYVEYTQRVTTSVKKCDYSKMCGFHVGSFRNFRSVAYREHHNFGICVVHSKGDHKVSKSVIIVKCADFTWDLPVTFGALRIVSIIALGYV